MDTTSRTNWKYYFDFKNKIRFLINGSKKISAIRKFRTHKNQQYIKNLKVSQKNFFSSQEDLSNHKLILKSPQKDLQLTYVF